MSSSAKPKKPKGRRHVYITERTRPEEIAGFKQAGRQAGRLGLAPAPMMHLLQYLSHDVPTVDTVIEEDKLQKRLQLAREQHNWKAEAQALLQLGQLMKWKGRDAIGDEYLAQSASLLRNNTFADDEHSMET
ncbi:hypothetical protein PINS_up023428 [Pythium insidiosum]|nr:hypothetical protein PINS_up023428 [Pythium insidiosum]